MEKKWLAVILLLLVMAAGCIATANKTAGFRILSKSGNIEKLMLPHNGEQVSLTLTDSETDSKHYTSHTYELNEFGRHIQHKHFASDALISDQIFYRGWDAEYNYTMTERDSRSNERLCFSNGSYIYISVDGNETIRKEGIGCQNTLEGMS